MKKKNKFYNNQRFLFILVISIIVLIVFFIGLDAIGGGSWPVSDIDNSLQTAKACTSCSSSDCADGYCPDITTNGKTYQQYCTKKIDDSGCMCKPKPYNPFGGTGYWCAACRGIKYENCYLYDDCGNRLVCRGSTSLNPFNNYNCKCQDPYSGDGNCKWDPNSKTCVGRLDCYDDEKCLKIGENQCGCVAEKNGCGFEYNSLKESGQEPGEEQCNIIGREVCPYLLECLYYDTECASDYPSNWFERHTPNYVCQCTIPCEADVPASQYGCGLRVPCCGSKNEKGKVDNECKKEKWRDKCYCEKILL